MTGANLSSNPSGYRGLAIVVDFDVIGLPNEVYAYHDATLWELVENDDDANLALALVVKTEIEAPLAPFALHFEGLGAIRGDGVFYAVVPPTCQTVEDDREMTFYLVFREDGEVPIPTLIRLPSYPHYRFP